jgi:hypothetical protein
MPTARVSLTFEVPDNRIQELIGALRETAETLADGWRCPDVGDSDMRCELDRDHDGDRHTCGNISWTNKTFVAGHVPHPPGCTSMMTHHHWQAPDGTDWVMPGTRADCEAKGVAHLVSWSAGKR